MNSVHTSQINSKIQSSQPDHVVLHIGGNDLDVTQVNEQYCVELVLKLVLLAETFISRHILQSVTICELLPRQKTRHMASFFSSVFTIEPEGDLPLMHPIEVKQECIEKTFKESEILKLLQNLDVNKSCGPDGLHPKMLKELSATISKPITIIFNSSMCQGLVPKLWKEGNIIALFNKGDKTEPGNCRPVSLTSVICKTMEKLVRETIVKHMSANKLFSNKQFGFISGRSTTLQLLKVMDEWTNILDKGGKIDSVYMDFMKAFDKVPHRRLLHTMHRYKISQKVIKWVECFLSNRIQKVIVNGTESKCHHVTSGIPQGSVLGPMLFVIYINDMP